MTPRRKTTSDAIEIIDRMIAGDEEMLALIDEEVENVQIAALIRAAREDAGMTQVQLAAAIGSTQPSIARLEDGAYCGHSLGMLRRIAAALGKSIELRFVPMGRRGR